MLLREELRFPWAVTGPFDRAPLAREASVCLGVLICDFSMHPRSKEFKTVSRDVIDREGDAARENGVNSL